MSRPKETEKLEAVKIRRVLLDKARTAFTWLRSKMDDPSKFTLAGYISDCLEGKRNLLDDYATCIREQAKHLPK